jgi:Na+/proline symporter
MLKRQYLIILIKKNSIGDLTNGMNWFFLCVLSMFAIFLLPRQFHTAIVENNKENLSEQLGIFSFVFVTVQYFFVFPIAWEEILCFKAKGLNSDTYSLLIRISTIIFLRLSYFWRVSAISMIIVSSIVFGNHATIF